jgi:predicted small lipoprotein YifL
MSLMLQILVRVGSLAALVTMMACGQQGPLYLPQNGGPQAATLPESLRPAKATSEQVAPVQPVAVPGAAQLPPSATP